MIKAYFYFKHERLNIGSVDDGTDIFDYLSKYSLDPDNHLYFYFHELPKVGEIIEFTQYAVKVRVVEIMHLLNSHEEKVNSHQVKVLCEQIHLVHFKDFASE